VGRGSGGAAAAPPSHPLQTPVISTAGRNLLNSFNQSFDFLLPKPPLLEGAGGGVINKCAKAEQAPPLPQ